jgi:hypothetical protein
MPRHPQLDLLLPEQIWLQSLLAKVEGLIPWQVFEHLDKCGKDEVFATCRGCGAWETFYYRCSLKFCPLCNWRITLERRKMLNLWSLQIAQPKHIVITMRNFAVLTRGKIRKFGRAFAKLRRNRIWKLVKGGCVSTEITNEGKGWHLHAHILADVRWLDAGALAIEWGKLIGQEFGIVKVKDVRGTEYLQEVSKYVCKPAEMVSWAPEEIAQFIRAIRGVRMFAAFGSLFKLQRAIRRQLEALKPEPKPCACGCTERIFETEASAIVGQIRKEERR